MKRSDGELMKGFVWKKKWVQSTQKSNSKEVICSIILKKPNFTRFMKPD